MLNLLYSNLKERRFMKLQSFFSIFKMEVADLTPAA